MTSAALRYIEPVRAPISIVLLVGLVACDGGRDVPEGTVGGSDASTSPDAATNCGADDGLEATCGRLCDAFASPSCQLLDLHVPYVYRIYVNKGDARADCVRECVEGDTRMQSLSGLAAQCGPELRAYIDRIAQNRCVNADPPRNFDGQWDWTGAGEQAGGLTACAERCVGLPTCNAATCSGSLSAGGVTCFWQCSGRTCEQMCN